MPSATDNIDAALTRFETLPPFQRLICQVLAVYGDSMTLGKIAKASKSCIAAMEPLGKSVPAKLIQARFKEVLERLTKMNIAVRAPHSSYELHLELLDPILQSAMADNRFALIQSTVSGNQISQFQSRGISPHRLRIAFYNGDLDAFQKQSPPDFAQLGVLRNFDPKVYDMLPSQMHDIFWDHTARLLIRDADFSADSFERFYDWAMQQTAADVTRIATITDVFLAGGDVEHIDCLAELIGKQHPVLFACKALLSGDHDQALQHFRNALPETKMSRAGAKPWVGSLSGLFYGMLLAGSELPDDATRLKKLLTVAKKADNDSYSTAFSSLRNAAGYDQTLRARTKLVNQLTTTGINPLTQLANAYCWTIALDAESNPLAIQNLSSLADAYTHSGLLFLAAEAFQLHGLCGDKTSSSSRQKAENLYYETNTKALAGS
ncbi:MAG: hypothetical protein AAFP90_14805, partial [Planctomycetota bacterium]